MNVSSHTETRGIVFVSFSVLSSDSFIFWPVEIYRAYIYPKHRFSWPSDTVVRDKFCKDCRELCGICHVANSSESHSYFQNSVSTISHRDL